MNQPSLKVRWSAFGAYGNPAAARQENVFIEKEHYVGRSVVDREKIR
jgi:hypothetical protein